MLFFNFKVALVNRESLYIGFLLLITICCFSENILARAYGSIFFAFFNALFLLYIASKQTESITV